MRCVVEAVFAQVNAPRPMTAFVTNGETLANRVVLVTRQQVVTSLLDPMTDVWTACGRSAVASARLHAAFLECRTCFRGGQKFDQRLGRLCFLSTDDQAA